MATRRTTRLKACARETPTVTAPFGQSFLVIDDSQEAPYMILADVMKYVFLVLGALIVFVAYWLAARALFPDAVEHARDAYGRRPLHLLTSGTLVALPLVLLGAALVDGAVNGAVKLLGGVLIAIPLLLGLGGSAGLSERLGRGLVHVNNAHSPWRRSLRGGIVLALTFLLPVVGWFCVLPLTLLSGVGACIVLSREQRSRSAPMLPGGV